LPAIRVVKTEETLKYQFGESPEDVKNLKADAFLEFVANAVSSKIEPTIMSEEPILD